MDILLLLKLLWRKKWIIVGIPLIAILAAYLFSSKIQDQFRSSAQISAGLITPDQIRLSDDDRFNPRDAEIKFSNLLTTINSGIVFNLLSYKLILHDLEAKGESPFRMPNEEFVSTAEEREMVAQLFKQKLKTLSPLSTSDSLFSLMRKYLNAYGYGFSYVRDKTQIKRIPNTDYIQIDFVSENPHLSAFAANSFCDEFIRYENTLQSSRGEESVEFLKQLADEKKTELDDKLGTLKIFKADNSMLNAQFEGEAKLGQIEEFERKRDDARSKLHGLDLTIKRLNSEISALSDDKPNMSSRDNQRIVFLRDKINNLNEKYILGGSSSQVLLDSLDMLRTEYQGLMSTVNRPTNIANKEETLYTLRSKLKDAEIEYQVERSNLEMAEAKIRSTQYSLSGYASKEAQVSAIQKEVDIASQEYLDAMNRYNDAKNKLMVNNSLRQIVVASPAVSPESSKQLVIVGLAGFASFILCVFVIVGLEIIDQRIRSTDKFERIVGLPLIGALNQVDPKTYNLRSYFSQTSTDENIEMFKAMLRKFRHEIENANKKVILFTSSKRGEGKTFTIFSLAYALSLINKRILIIDTNFKNNALSQLLGQSSMKVIEGKRIQNLLLVDPKGTKAEPEEFDTNENTYDLLNPTKFKNIFIICNAGGNDSPAEILSGRNFKNLVSILSGSFDYIFLEGAALNEHSDTKELVAFADMVVPVFSADSVIKTLDKDSISYFESLGDKLGGCLLNKVDGKDLKL